uniref:BRO1 domain-containing protein n=1 Tax=Ditylenchus dipsaci TaxID=166011 RepID=A0A915EJP3_9BILA
MVNFICVPLKSTTEVDLLKPLKTYVDSLPDVKNDLKTEINEGIVELNKLRNRACIQPLDRHQSSLDVLTRYYDQLSVMENKLPITPTQNPISFKWKDAFSKPSVLFSRASLTINDSSFERACVLFNCGALMSSIAAAQQVHTDEELKAMAKLFQQAAGVFSKLKDSVLGLVQQEPTPDLMPDTLSALSSLMLAQAQEAIYIKAATDQMKQSALVKISSQCAEFYQECQKVMSRDIVKGIWEKEWLKIVSGKSLAYTAIAQYHQSNVAEDAKEIGEQLARLKEAIRLMDQANSYLTVTSHFSAENAAIKKSWEQANKDNDFIYHVRLPEFRSLPSLPRAALAKALPVVVPVSPRFKDLFESLVPVSVQTALVFFESRKSEVVNMETSRMREYTQIINACLASLNLPAALDDVKNHEKLPESIRQKSAKVKNSGGFDSINKKLRELPSLYKRNEEILNEISRLLKDEKDTDDSLRAQLREKWSRVPSEKLTPPLVQELGKYRGILQTASAADLILLSKTENELKAAIPGLSNATAQANSTAVPKLLELMHEVQEIKVEREEIEKALNSEFLKSMSENGMVNEEKLSSDKIQELFQPYKQRVEDSLKKQERVMNEVEVWNNKFTEEKHGSGSSERDNFLKLLATAYDAYFGLEENLVEGTKFYNDLTPILVRLQQKVSDFCFARQTEKEDLMKQVQQNIVSGNAEESSQQVKNPPPRPPPPAAPQTNQTTQQPHQQWNQAPAPHLPSYPYQPSPPSQQQQQAYPQGGGYQQPNNPYAPAAPYGQQPSYPYANAPPPQQNTPGQQQYQPQFQQTYSTPYPIQYPGTYPGAYQHGGYPPQPQFPQPPPHQQQQPPHNPNPFQ